MATFIEARFGVNNDATDIDTPISTPSNVFATINAGDTIIVAALWEGADDTPTVYDTAANNYTALTKRKDPAQNSWVQLFYYRYTSSASNQCVFLGNGATATYKNIIAARFSGLGANPFSAEDYNSQAGSTSVTLSSALSISGAGVIVGAVHAFNTQGTMTAGPTGFALAGTTAPNYVFLSYKEYTGADSAAVSFTGNSSTSWIMSAAAFLDAGGGGGSTIVPKSTRLTMLGIG